MSKTRKQSRDGTLRETEEYFRALIEDVSDIITILDADGMICYESPSVERILGYAPNELVGLNAFEFVHPEDLTIVEQRFSYTLQHPGTPQSAWFRFRHKDGSWRVLESLGKALPADSGNRNRIVITSRDITERKQFEDQIRRSEMMLAEAEEMAHLGSWEWDIKANRITWSDELYRIYGIKSEEFNASFEGYLARVHPDDRGATKEIIKQALHSRRPFSFYERIVRPDGKPRILWSRGRVEVDQAGKPVRMIGTCQDITEQKRAEEEIRLLLTIAQAMLEAPDMNSALGVALTKVCEMSKLAYGEAWLPSHDQAHLVCCPAWYSGSKDLEKFRRISEEMRIRKEQGLPGRVWKTKKPEWVKDVTAESRKIFYRAQTAQEIGFKSALAVPILAEAEVLAILTFYMFETQEEDPRSIELVSAVAAQLGSIIQRKWAEEELQKYVKRIEALRAIDKQILAAQSLTAIAHAALKPFGQLVARCQASVMTFDFDGGKAALLATLGPAGLAQQRREFDLAELKIPGELKQRKIKQVQDAGRSRTQAFGFPMPGTGNLQSYLNVPLTYQKELIGCISLGSEYAAAFTKEHIEILREVADQLAIAIQQARMQEQLELYAAELEKRVAERTAALREINAELEAFASTISHDLRAPLQTILGFAQVIQKDYGSELNPHVKKHLERIIMATRRMETMIRDLLAYSRYSRDTLQLHSVHLELVVREARQQIEGAFKENQADLQIRTPLPKVIGHHTTMVQVMTNLLSNAIKFVASDVKPGIRIWAEEQGERVRLFVQDNGIGIEAEDHKRVFNIFERIRSNKAYPGTGIGLAIVRKAVERMGGLVGVQSRPGEGSTFWIELAKSDKQSAASPTLD